MSAEMSAAEFPAFYEAINGYPPFPWQARLAEHVCTGSWPKSLNLPTATGKTSCIEIALFAMAVRGEGPRRIFFVIDRRVIVDQAYEQMQKIASALAKPGTEILKRTAARLVQIGGDPDEPVTAYQMRGGIYRDDSWVRSPLQPTLVASTVDQVGSRILFRGYGASDKTWPIHAALTANDALILLDEAHCSRAFAETLAAVESYRNGSWAEQDLRMPFAFVEMTATPFRADSEPFELGPEDYIHAVLRRRLFAPKPTKLVTVSARLNEREKYACALADEAVALAKEPNTKRIAVMVNRVRTAKAVRDELRKRALDVDLLIGRMRPVDREALPPEISAMKSGRRRDPAAKTRYVVATQCLEVGADLDFDGLVTECASIDALLQRFGRLDRTGALSMSGSIPQARIVASPAMTDQKHQDAVYKQALAKTWEWLAEIGDLNFGTKAENGLTVRDKFEALANDHGHTAAELKREAPSAPRLWPSHLDAFVQTAPRTAIEPDPQVFLHGNENSSPEVQVVWRADLNGVAPELWKDIVALCPPVVAEAMPVPLRDFRRWATDSEKAEIGGSDVEGGEVEEEGRRRTDDLTLRFPFLRWFGDQSTICLPAGDKGIDDVQPGDTLVIAEETGGWDELGHVPKLDGRRLIDSAEHARVSLGRRRWVLRLHPQLIEDWPDNEAKAGVLELCGPVEPTEDEIRSRLAAYAAQVAPEHWLHTLLANLPTRITVSEYPAPEGEHIGWIVTATSAEADFGQDEASAAKEVKLQRHLDDVAAETARLADMLQFGEDLRNSLDFAARHHDSGKADLRFQALLRGGDPTIVQLGAPLLAKGDKTRATPKARQAQWRRSGLPDGFRHEAVSLAIAADIGDARDDLALHLIASHHGWCRPFVRVFGNPIAVAWNGHELTEERVNELAAFRIASGAGDRFWRLNRRFGWWGVAYLEAILRLADWEASRKESEE